ncbi:uncharacterized protein BDR25DRAFT_384596 [Lindgomyces ingoldianus]|uniref:Uncharacterized protein n=1 Tax=Lindgomyces ingoldianus TaxID=673940 RepID=A0ACB6R6X6_9PLEO|nr:uncharacterized protein BDR25DRAFT_384596 [Lindgomyces ingoldianus]KAF2475054.1 hypothetical protein BDR25DRAFT_384596 [Lindgomyces ingoldianus]
MRQRSGCKTCRERHIKCVKLRDSSKCKHCTERDRPCVKGNAFRFRPVTSVKFNAGEDIGSAEQSLNFQTSQTWVDIPESLRFVPPNTDPDDLGEPDEPGEGVLDAEPDSTLEDSGIAFRPSIDIETNPLKGLPAISPSAGVAPLQPPIYDTLNNTISPHEVPNNKVSPPQDFNISPFGSSSAFSASTSLSPRWPVSNAYEARLLHHFIVHCTPWIDVCDPRCHFGKEIPKRAAQYPVILNGVLGLAARHLWLLSKVEEDHSAPYIDQCLQTLIIALEDPLAHWDENFLIAVILLRLHEEMGDSDEQCHHFGTTRILNSISSFAADGGLRESASWVSLRQHIYVSLTTQQPLDLSLENYRHSSVFREYDDEAWANRAIFLFANVLKHVFEGRESSPLSRDKWAELDAEVNEWERTKPWTFTPLFTEERAGKEFNGSWPELPTAQGVVAVGLQYYHLCKILLSIYSPHASLVGLASVRARKATDAAIRQHIRIIIGYGVSNSHCGNAMFQGSHILSACGAYIIEKAEQEACVEYLRGLQDLIGWRTTNVLQDLREQWSN